MSFLKLNIKQWKDLLLLSGASKSFCNIPLTRLEIVLSVLSELN